MLDLIVEVAVKIPKKPNKQANKQTKKHRGKQASKDELKKKRHELQEILKSQIELRTVKNLQRHKFYSYSQATLKSHVSRGHCCPGLELILFPSCIVSHVYTAEGI